MSGSTEESKRSEKKASEGFESESGKKWRFEEDREKREGKDSPSFLHEVDLRNEYQQLPEIKKAQRTRMKSVSERTPRIGKRTPLLSSFRRTFSAKSFASLKTVLKPP